METSRKGGNLCVCIIILIFSKTSNLPSLHYAVDQSKYPMVCAAVDNWHKGICVQAFQAIEGRGKFVAGEKPNCALPTPIVLLHNRLGARAKNHSRFPF